MALESKSDPCEEVEVSYFSEVSTTGKLCIDPCRIWKCVFKKLCERVYSIRGVIVNKDEREGALPFVSLSVTCYLYIRVNPDGKLFTIKVYETRPDPENVWIDTGDYTLLSKKLSDSVKGTSSEITLYPTLQAVMGGKLNITMEVELLGDFSPTELENCSFFWSDASHVWQRISASSLFSLTENSPLLFKPFNSEIYFYWNHFKTYCVDISLKKGIRLDIDARFHNLIPNVYRFIIPGKPSKMKTIIYEKGLKNVTGLYIGGSEETIYISSSFIPEIPSGTDMNDVQISVHSLTQKKSATIKDALGTILSDISKSAE